MMKKQIFKKLKPTVKEVKYVFVIILLILASFGMGTKLVNFEYYEKFCNYLKSSSNMYDNISDDEMKEYYKSWVNNTGFADVIIGVDGELEDAFEGTEDIIQCIDTSDLSQGIYIYNDDQYSHVILLSMNDSYEGRLTMIRAKLDDCYYHTIFSSSIFIESENKYKIHDSKDIYLEFTDYGTVSVTNGSGSTYIDEHTIPDNFTGEYLPIHSF